MDSSQACRRLFRNADLAMSHLHLEWRSLAAENISASIFASSQRATSILCVEIKLWATPLELFHEAAEDVMAKTAIARPLDVFF